MSAQPLRRLAFVAVGSACTERSADLVRLLANTAATTKEIRAAFSRVDEPPLDALEQQGDLSSDPKLEQALIQMDQKALEAAGNFLGAETRVVLVQCISVLSGTSRFRFVVGQGGTTSEDFSGAVSTESDVRRVLVATAFENLDSLVDARMLVDIAPDDRCNSGAKRCVLYGSSFDAQVSVTPRGNLLRAGDLVTSLTPRCDDDGARPRPGGHHGACVDEKRGPEGRYRLFPLRPSGTVDLSLQVKADLSGFEARASGASPVRSLKERREEVRVRPAHVLVDTTQYAGLRTYRTEDVKLAIDQRRILPFWPVTTNAGYLSRKMRQLSLLSGDDVLAVGEMVRAALLETGPPNGAMAPDGYRALIERENWNVLAYHWVSGGGLYLERDVSGSSVADHLDLVGLEACRKLASMLEKELSGNSHGLDEWLERCNGVGRGALAGAAGNLQPLAGYEIPVLRSFPSRLLKFPASAWGPGGVRVPVGELRLDSTRRGYPVAESYQFRAYDQAGVNSLPARLDVHVHRMPDIRAAFAAAWNVGKGPEGHFLAGEVSAPFAWDLVELGGSVYSPTFDRSKSVGYFVMGQLQLMQLFNLFALSGNAHAEFGGLEDHPEGIFEYLQMGVGGGYDFTLRKPLLVATVGWEFLSLLRIGARYERIDEMDLLGGFAGLGYSN